MLSTIAEAKTSTRLDENHKRDYQNATPLLALEDVTAASVGKVQKHDIQEVALAVDNPLLESLVPEKWKLMGRYDDFHTLDEVRKAKNVRCCRMEVKDGITEKYYRCYSCNYKMWSRERGDKCVLYYSGQHNHPFEQLDVKPEIPHTTDSVTSDVLKPPTVSKVVPIVVNLSDPDTQIINGALAEVKCTPFSCYSLSCLTQIAVEFGLQLILDDFNQGQFSLRKCDFLIKFVITEAAITIIFREGADLTHSESRASMDWGRFLTAIRTKCTNFFKN
uniref:FLYWCH-type domain-containing protein n=1 Tax=Panagrellus redivivus TaxID=6233 RepID=A0A7E4W470_PANRE